MPNELTSGVLVERCKDVELLRQQYVTVHILHKVAYWNLPKEEAYMKAAEDRYTKKLEEVNRLAHEEADALEAYRQAEPNGVEKHND